jgi:type IV secretory pathway TrbL component
MARGRPSRRAQISATAAALAAVRANRGLAAAARSTNSRTAAIASSSAGSRGSRSGSGTGSGGTAYSCSPRSDSTTREVTIARSPGAAPSSSSRTGPASATCS